MKRSTESDAPETRWGSWSKSSLLLARLDEGQSFDRQPVDLAQLVNDVVADASTTDPFRTVTVHATGPVVVEGDLFALRRVVANLVNNALRHTAEDARIEVRLSSDEQTARLEVEDSGPGMTSEELSHAFDRFWQADTSRSRSGAGLGSAHCARRSSRLTEAMSRSSLPIRTLHGTRFTVTCSSKRGIERRPRSQQRATGERDLVERREKRGHDVAVSLGPPR